MGWKEIVLNLLNLTDTEEKDEVVSSMPKLLKEFYREIRASEESVTMSMANVGQKRISLSNLEKKLTQKEAEFKLIYPQDKSLAEAYYVSDILPIEEDMSELMGVIETLDVQTQTEIENFQEMKKRADEMKSEIKHAEHLKRFTDINDRMATAGRNVENSSAYAKLEVKLEEVHFDAAKAAARLALQNKSTPTVSNEAKQARAMIREQTSDARLLAFKAHVGVLPRSTETDDEKDETVSAHDQAKNLLQAPAFSGILHKKGE